VRRKKITGGDSRIGERIRIILFGQSLPEMSQRIMKNSYSREEKHRSRHHLKQSRHRYFLREILSGCQRRR
jgi:hypothetical protein